MTKKNLSGKVVTIFGLGRMGLRFVKICKSLGASRVQGLDINEAALRKAKTNAGAKGIFCKLSPNQGFGHLAVLATTADSRVTSGLVAIKNKTPFILFEKPFACSLADCIKLLNAAKRAGCSISVNHQMRFMPQYFKVKRYLCSKKFGGLSCMTVIGGNFGLAMNGIHYFEAFRFLTDEKPWRVMAWLDRKVVPNPRGKKFKDRSGCVIVETRSGKRLILQCSVGQGHGIHVTYAARNGWITVDELTGTVQASVRQAKFRDEPTTRYALPSRNWSEIIKPAEIFDSTAAVIRALLKNKNRVTGEDGLLAVKVLVAAHLSAERGGRPVAINGRLDLHRKFPWA